MVVITVLVNIFLIKDELKNGVYNGEEENGVYKMTCDNYDGLYLYRTDRQTVGQTFQRTPSKEGHSEE